MRKSTRNITESNMASCNVDETASDYVENRHNSSSSDDETVSSGHKINK